MAKKSRVPEGKVVNYSYLKPINKKFIVKTAIETGNNMSECLDAFMDSIRTGKPVKLKSRTPKYVQQATKVAANKKEKMKALTSKAKKTTKVAQKATRAKRKTTLVVQPTAAM